ncbi:MAG: hypothetical protein ACREID_08370 [Planctomycetota bacterium]
MARRRRAGYRRGRAWAVIERHFGSRNAFAAIHEEYEARVAKLVQERGIARDDLKLTPEETTTLFDTKRLEELIREHVGPLRDAAHAHFRDSDVAEPYDSEASKIFHELSILKEEHLSVRDFPRDGDGREFARLFREVSEYYPQRLRRVRDLLERAQKRLDAIVPQFGADPIVLRSAFLFREELWPGEAEEGLTIFLSHMFPQQGPIHGYLEVAKSFLKGGFFDKSAECAKMGVAAAGREATPRTTHAQQVRDTIRELDKLGARAAAEVKALEELDA